MEEKKLTGIIIHQLRHHAPFTAMGSLAGIMVMLVCIWIGLEHQGVTTAFWLTHPAHVLLSAYVTTAMYSRMAKPSLWKALLIGYLGSVGIGTLSDSLIPYAGEWILQMEHHEAHIGFIEKWWLINPLALLGIAGGYLVRKTRMPHFAHVLLSTWASLFHMMMARGDQTPMTIGLAAGIAVFLFIAVWIPCCTSDIVFPLLFTGYVPPCNCPGHAHDHEEKV
ncbi:MAG: hypothetical protein AB7T27_06020 [Kiritimatiellia bacterium]